MSYSAPVGDISHILKNVAGINELIGQDLYEDLDEDVVDAILEEAGKFASEQLAPLNRQGDLEGARLEDGDVRMPAGWDAIYKQWIEAGWGSLPCPADFGGQGLPILLSTAVGEMWQSSCMAFSLNPLLTQGAAEALYYHGTDELKATYLEKMVSGEWTGTMQLTEPQSGSDLHLLKTKAVPEPDGSYLLSGTKIFITYGDHDLAENIVHMVLARINDAPGGTRGISLFLVPKFLVNDDGSLGERNDIFCASLEHKLGIHASPTCVMQMGDNGGARGWLVGEENRGLSAMFFMMNRARLGVGIQGVGIAERATQAAIAYAQDRKQGTVDKDPVAPMVRIDRHPDVRRMLMSMKAKTAAARAICFVTAREIDRSERLAEGEEKEKALGLAGLLTPVAKAFSTDLGVEVASEGIQVHGGMGFIEETGVAQHFRDARIAPIYEGTNGIQAMDLVVRKLPMADGDIVRGQIASLRDVIESVRESNLPAFGSTAERLHEAVEALAEATDWMLETLPNSRDHAYAGATPYLRLFGLASGGAYLARGALAAGRKDAGTANEQIAIARFFAEHCAVEASGLARTVISGADAVIEASQHALPA